MVFSTMHDTTNDPSEMDQPVLKAALHPHPALQFSYPLPYGAILHEGGVQFVVFSRSATAMRLLLYNHQDDPEPTEIIPFNRDTDRWGDVWSIFLPGVVPGQLYHFQADGPFDPERGQRFDGRARLVDPFARALAGRFLPATDGIVRPPKCVVIDDAFDWQGDRHLRRNLSDTVIYELHVRGFTRDPSSRTNHPGTYLGVIEKIPYLKSLGVTAVELMPVHEFPMQSPLGHDLARPNYWGYDPLAFFAPHQGYASSKEPGAQVVEFKQMVQALHRAGIEVIVDVVFNHTAEGNERGPTLSFKGLENRVYYMLGNGGSYYRNYSAAAATRSTGIIRSSAVPQIDLLIACGIGFTTITIDGFRHFDLASMLEPRSKRRSSFRIRRWSNGLRKIRCWPIRRSSPKPGMLPAAYQVGSFANQRWARSGTDTIVMMLAVTGREIGVKPGRWRRDSPARATCTSRAVAGRTTASTL